MSFGQFSVFKNILIKTKHVVSSALGRVTKFMITLTITQSFYKLSRIFLVSAYVCAFIFLSVSKIFHDSKELL